MTQSYRNFISQNIKFATAALICTGGTRHYLAGNIGNETIEKCKQDAPKGERMLAELLFASVVDNFNCYLSDVLVEILNEDHRPISGKKFSALEAFSTDSIEDLRKRMLEKFVLDLGYQKIDDLTDFLGKNFGLKTLDHWLTRKRVARYIQIRNIITHNRGSVNKTFLYRSGSRRDKEGEKVFVPFVLHAARYFDGLVRRLDNEVTGKFLRDGRSVGA